MNSSAKVERTFRYGPYGENVKSEGTQTIPYPFGYKSGYRTPGGNKGEGNVANGLYHYGERYYDPTTGRWTQPDPAGGGNAYSFVSGDPINQTDPAGEMGMAGMETTAAQDTVKWCTQHPYAYYHNQSIYGHCQKAAQAANPGSDECHMWGTLIALVGLPEDGISVLVARAAKAVGLGMLISC